MNQFSIGDIENLTRIKAHTLRIWEQRYRFAGLPKRTTSGHRYYDNEDLKSILRIAYLYHDGFKISRIAEMDDAQIKELTLVSLDTPSPSGNWLNTLFEASIDLDEERFSILMDDGIEALGMQSFMLDVVFPFLGKLGALWLTGHVIPSQEHFASEIIIRKLLYAKQLLPDVTSVVHDRKVAVFTPLGEFHEIPILFVSYLLKKNGIPQVYFGRNVTLDLLGAYARAHAFNELYFHLITNFSLQGLDEYLGALQEHFPGAAIYFSGLTTAVPLPEHVHYLKDPSSILLFTR